MNLTEILERAGKLRIAVVGDLIQDRYIDGVIERISPEAPVPILKITGTRENWGGAGNVVRNLEGLGCQVSFFYDDKNVIIKTRVMSGTHHILRMDDEESTPRLVHWDDIDINLGYGLEHGKFDCVVISDYGKGMINRSVTSELIRLCNHYNVPVIADSKHQKNLMHFATLVKCNLSEWKKFREDRSNKIDSPWAYLNAWDVQNLVVTNGDHGMQYFGLDDGGDLELSGNIPGEKIAICDACGAGDTVTAVLAMMVAIGEPIDKACELANTAASEVCRHPGVYAIKQSDLLNRSTETLPTNGQTHERKLLE